MGRSPKGQSRGIIITNHVDTKKRKTEGVIVLIAVASIEREDHVLESGPRSAMRSPGRSGAENTRRGMSVSRQNIEEKVPEEKLGIEAVARGLRSDPEGGKVLLKIGAIPLGGTRR